AGILFIFSPVLRHVSLEFFPTFDHLGWNEISFCFRFNEEMTCIGRSPAVSAFGTWPIRKSAIALLETLQSIDSRAYVGLNCRLLRIGQRFHLIEIKLRENRRRSLFNATVRILQKIFQTLPKIDRRQGRYFQDG